MIKTIEGKRWQFRFDWTGAAVFFGQDRLWTVQLHWWRRPRFVVRHDHDIKVSFPRWYR